MKSNFINKDCEACTFTASKPGVADDRSDWPTGLISIKKDVDQAVGKWAENFYRCKECKAIYQIVFNPKDGYYSPGKIPPETLPALMEDADLETVWPFSLEDYHTYIPFHVYQEHGHFDIQNAYERFKACLLATDDIGLIKRYVMILARLVSPLNSEHKALLQDQDWLIVDNDDALFKFMFQQVENPAGTELNNYYSEMISSDARIFLNCALGTDKLKARVKTDSAIHKKYADPEKQFRAKRNQQYKERITLNIHSRQTTELEDDKTWGPREPVLQRGIKSGIHYLTPFTRFIPAILIAIFLLEILTPNIGPDSQPFGYGIFLFMTMVWYCAAAAQNAGIWLDRSLWILARQRISVSMDYLWFIFIASLLTVLAIGIASSGNWIVEENRYTFVSYVLPIITILLLLRMWPFIMVPFVYAGVSRWSSIVAANVWKGPGLFSAWRLTAHRKVFLRLSIPMTLFLIFTFIINLWLSDQFGAAARIPLLYIISLPLVVTMNTAFLEEIALFDELWQEIEKDDNK